MALISAFIGKSMGLRTRGTSSNAVESSSSATAAMSIGTLMRYAARTS